MHVFADALGRRWQIAINVFAVKKVRAVLAVDLNTLLDDKMQGLSSLIRDPAKLCDVLYVLCETQAKELKVSDEEFGRGLYGDVIGEATEAFVEELIDFFPDPKARESLRKIMATGRTMGRKLMEHGEKMIAQIDADVEAEKLMSSLIKRQESLESILTLEHSEKST